MKVGDKVKIRSDIYEGDDFHVYVNEDMLKYAGRVVTLKRIYDGDWLIEEDDEEWTWSEDLFVPAKDTKFAVGDRVCIRRDLKAGCNIRYGVTQSMAEHAGEWAIIIDASISNDGTADKYRIDIGEPYQWALEMFDMSNSRRQEIMQQITELEAELRALDGEDESR